MFIRLSILAFVGVALVYGDANCNTNRKGDAWCARRINEMKTLSGYNAAQPAAPFTGQLCTTAAADNGLFRDTFCCKACKEFLGGGTQAIKDTSYMGTAVGKICADNTAFAAYCTQFSPSHALCQPAAGQNVATKYCEYTCGLCSTTNQDMIHSTQAACTGLAPCHNQTECKRSATVGSGQCTTDGLVPGDGTAAPFLDGGTCNCAECTGYLGKACTSDDTCGGFDHHCQAMEGKCNCGKCELDKVCFSDDDCGGTVGTCGYISNDATDKLKLFRCPATKFGPLFELCRCNWCPGPTACRNHLVDCTPQNAVATCGHASFCVGEAGSQKCGCKPLAVYTGTDAYLMPAIADVATTGIAQICITGILCGTDAGVGPAQCGYGNEGACRALDGVSTCTGAMADMTCKCNCAAITAPPTPNYCMGFQTAADGTTALSCSLGGTTECGQGTATGDTKKDMCAPDYNTGMCICGIALYPKWSAFSGTKCSSYTDCQSATDTSAICLKTAVATGAAEAACAADDATGGLCFCHPATAANVVFAEAGAKCTLDAQCGWGKCMDEHSLMKCPPGATTCICVSAGCVDGQACGLAVSPDTCGGTAGCEGKCFCG